MAEQYLFGKTYHIDDLGCDDHGEAARYVAEQVLNAKREHPFERAKSFYRV